MDTNRYSDYDSDGASSLASCGSAEAWNDPVSQDSESVTSVPPADIIKFLHDTFRKKHVKIKDFFPDLSSFIISAKLLLLKAGQLGVTESQVYRLRKCILKAKNELQT